VARSPWLLVGALGAAQLALSWAGWWTARQVRVTYVFTPLVDVIPSSVALSEEEAARVGQDLRHQVDARDMQSAYARMGSTIALEDLLQGVESLDAAGLGLSGGQRERVGQVLDDARRQHEELLAVQVELLDLEARLGGELRALEDQLPPDLRALVAPLRRGPAHRRPPGDHPAPGRGPGTP